MAKLSLQKTLRQVLTVGILSLCSAVFGISTASASTGYDWTYYSFDLHTVIGSGTLTVDGTNLMTDIHGSIADGFGPDIIVGLISGDCCGGNGPTTDQLYIPAGTNNGGHGNAANSYLDAYGFDVVTIHGVDVNMWARIAAPNDGCESSDGTGCGTGDGNGNGTFSITASTRQAPEPSSLVLFAIGLFALGAKRVRKAD
jgi:hypothetical protein